MLELSCWDPGAKPDGRRTLLHHRVESPGCAPQRFGFVESHPVLM